MSQVRQRPQKDRQQDILDAAIRVIAERGLVDTRISDIADLAGVSPALILYYFDTKDRVLAEALTFANDRFYLRMSREIRRLPSAKDQLTRLIEMSTPGYLPGENRLDSEWALWIEVWSRAIRDSQISKEREALDKRWRASIAEIIREGQQSGEFAAGDANELALRLSALIDGLAIQVVLNDSVVTPKRMRKTCLQMAAREIGFELRATSPSRVRKSGR